MMKDLVQRSSVRNAIFMMRQVERGKAVLIVEGEADSRSFGKVIRTSHCRIFSAGYPGGKDQALALFRDLKERKLPGVAALVDADCDRLWGKNRGHADICWTSATDREVMIIQSPAFAAFVAANFTVDPGALRARILGASFPLGCLRTMSRRKQWALDFKRIGFDSFIEPANGTCDEGACCREVLAWNQNANLLEADLLNAIAIVRARNPEQQDVVCGHDAVGILSFLSGPALGKELTINEIEQELAEHFGPPHFALTSSFTEITQWEGRNAPFLVNL